MADLSALVHNVPALGIPLNGKNEPRLFAATGKTPHEIKQLHEREGLPLRRFGEGNGVRYELDLDDYRDWLKSLPKD